jgi:hypothetical protein
MSEVLSTGSGRDSVTFDAGIALDTLVNDMPLGFDCMQLKSVKFLADMVVEELCKFSTEMPEVGE